MRMYGLASLLGLPPMPASVAQDKYHRIESVRVGGLDPALLLESQGALFQAGHQPDAHVFLSFPRLSLL